MWKSKYQKYKTLYLLKAGSRIDPPNQQPIIGSLSSDNEILESSIYSSQDFPQVPSAIPSLYTSQPLLQGMPSIKNVPPLSKVRKDLKEKQRRETIQAREKKIKQFCIQECGCYQKKKI